MAPVAVASADLPKGSLLESGHLVMETRDITKYRKPCLDPAQLEGRLVQRNIKAGSVIELTMVQVPPLIKKGETVKIVLNRGGLFLSTLGVAQTNGGKDEMIKVENISSNKILQCRVAAAGLVEVAL
jgi:flagella basal body P-ring formation protein FlgA